MRRRLSQDAWVLLILGFFLMLLGLVTRAHQKSTGGIDVIPKRSTYSTAPSGMKALYETLHDTGYNVTRHLEPFTVLPKDGVLFICSPEIPVSANEWDSLRKWTEKGNMLIVGPGIEPDEFNPSNKIDTSTSAPGVPSFAAPNVRVLRIPKHGAITDNEWDFKGYDPLGSPVNLPAAKKQKLKKSISPNVKSLIPLFRNPDGNTVGYCEWGHGSVIVLSNSWSLCNKGIGRDDNLIFVLNALNYRDPSHKLQITFDEFHHGYGRAPGLMSLIGTSAKIGLAQILFGFILLVFAVSRRFGRPIPLREGTRERSEYLSSMASLLKRAHATGIVRQELERKFLEDIAVVLGLPPIAEPDIILSTAISKRPDISDELYKLLAHTSAAPDEALDETEILLTAAKWDKMRKELMKKR